MSNIHDPPTFTSDHEKPIATENGYTAININEAVDVSGSTHSKDSSSSWTPGLRPQFPWLGLSALIAVLVCSAASVLVLALANNSPATKWLSGRLGPNVLIQMLNSASNFAITLAVGQGVAITWWRKALSGNHTIEELHYAWTFSTGISSIFKKIKYFNIIALAALMTKFAIIDGVLYQKSISTYIDVLPRQFTENVTTFSALQFPVTGTMGPTAQKGGTPEYYASGVVNFWIQMGEGLSQWTVVEGCNGASCLFGLKGAGFAVDCVDDKVLFDYGAHAQRVNATNSTALPFQDMPLFSVNFTRSWPSQNKTYSSLILETVYATPDTDDGAATSNGSCPMYLTKSTCELRPAVLNYTMQYLNPNSLARSAKKKSNAASQSFGYTSSLSDAAYTASQYDPGEASWNFGFNCEYNYSAPSDQTCGSYNQKVRQLNGVEVLSIHDVNESFIPGANSTLEGIFQAIEDVFSSKSVLSYNGSDWFVDLDGIIASNYLDFPPARGSCNYTTYDPKADIIRKVNYLTTLLSQSDWLYYPTKNASTDELDYDHPLYNIPASALIYDSIPSNVTYNEIFYSTNFHFVYGAVAATFVVIICICPVYYGFWKLGRKVTLGPLEIANAFQGPTFAGVPSDNVEGILEHIGNRNVVYGHVDAETGRRLAFMVNPSRS